MFTIYSQWIRCGFAVTVINDLISKQKQKHLSAKVCAQDTYRPISACENKELHKPTLRRTKAVGCNYFWAIETQRIEMQVVLEEQQPNMLRYTNSITEQKQCRRPKAETPQPNTLCIRRKHFPWRLTSKESETTQNKHHLPFTMVF